MEQADVAIVGAGPAGLAAAALLAGHGAEVVVIDERPRAGGQIYRQPPATFRGEGLPPGRSYAAGRELLAAAAGASGLRWKLGTLAWALFEPRDAGPTPGRGEATWVVALADEEAGIGRLAVRHVLVAAGAYDLPVAFPGWTLPGVMSAGGVQAFVKSEKLLPGGCFVLAGAHPLLLVVADQLLRAGAELAAVVFAQPRPRLRDGASVALGLRGRVAPVLGLAGPLARLRKHGVPLLSSHLIAAAEGASALEAVRIAPVDGAWRPTAGPERRFSCDTLAVGYGFVPSTELARQAGANHRWKPREGGWVTDHDDWMRSSLAGISVAGETAGIAGAEQAAEEGRLAAIGILRELGALDGEQAARAAAPVRRALARRRALSGLVARRFEPAYAALAALADEETVVCRCEEVTAGALRAALATHPHLGSADAVKLVTRAGMGPCQGRFCMLTVASLIAAASGRELAEVGPFHASAPVKPLPVSQLAAAWPGPDSL